MPAPLGIDIAGVEDVDPFLSFAEPRLAAAHALMRSLLHAPGALWWAPDRGFHLAHLLHGAFNAEAIETGIKAQLEVDERVESVEVETEILGGECRITIEVVFTNDPTATTFTISVDQAGSVILEGVTS